MVFAQLNPLQGPLCGIQLGKNLMGQAPGTICRRYGANEGVFYCGHSVFGSQFLFISIEEPNKFHNVFCAECISLYSCHAAT